MDNGALRFMIFNQFELQKRSEYKNQFTDNGMQISGKSPNGLLAEIVEIPEHPWFLAVQFHPEFKSKPLRPHPLFRGFVESALEHHKQKAPVSV